MVKITCSVLFILFLISTGLSAEPSRSPAVEPFDLSNQAPPKGAYFFETSKSVPYYPSKSRTKILGDVAILGAILLLPISLLFGLRGTATLPKSDVISLDEFRKNKKKNQSEEDDDIKKAS